MPKKLLFKMKLSLLLVLNLLHIRYIIIYQLDSVNIPCMFDNVIKWPPQTYCLLFANKQQNLWFLGVIMVLVSSGEITHIQSWRMGLLAAESDSRSHEEEKQKRRH